VGACVGAAVGGVAGEGDGGATAPQGLVVVTSPQSEGVGGGEGVGK
jgi:hypothetical protein